MSHRYFEGEIYHKRFMPKTHDFTYPFFMIDIALDELGTLSHRFFSLEKFNIFSFRSRDHFGSHEDFKENVNELLQKFSLEPTPGMRFITLPRIFNFVFNPISMLILFDGNTPTHLLAEVHNYNGGRIVYPVILTQSGAGRFEGESDKDMYVSPFLKRIGRYRFEIEYTPEKLLCSIRYSDGDDKVLQATLRAASRPFHSSVTRSLLWRHSFLTLKVVTRTLWQTLLLKLKGLAWFEPTPLDQIRRY